jgi:radical SAM superfamily enzyme YgiQ (UPF0313 family)
MNESKKVLIISVPHCEPYPMVAPVLLSACLNNAGISAKGIDFGILFLEHFANKPYYLELKNFITNGGLGDYYLSLTAFKDVIRFTKKFLIGIRKKYQPEYIGLSIFSTDSLDFGLILSYCIRKYCPGVKIIAGGKGLEIPHQNKDYQYQIWERNGVADIIVVGDAEIEIINSIKHNKTGIIFANQLVQEDLDSIPVPRWDEYDLSVYSKLSVYADATDEMKSIKTEPYMAITASKGCVRQCTFCDVIKFQPKYIYRAPEKVANEIIHNYRHTGIKKFKFTDNLINGSITNYRTINQILADTIPGEISYAGYAIFRGKHQMPEKDFELAARAGCTSWAIGVESGSEQVRNDMKKKFTNDDIDWSANMLFNYGINQVWLFMVGYPTETEKDFEDTKNLLKKYAYMAVNGRIIINVTPTFMLTTNAPLLSDPLLAESHGVSHNLQNQNTLSKFWTSSKNVENTYPVRSRRYKELLELIDTLGYRFYQGATINKSLEEIKHLDRIYNEQKNKFIPIYTTS